MKSDPNTNLIWIDLEMTGLDSSVHKIVEAALIVTNKDLEIIEESEPMIIWQSKEDVAAMSKEVRDLLDESGILTKISTSLLHEKDVEKQLLEICWRHVSYKASPLCGNSIYMDRIFLQKYMPELTDFVHYRNIDVSTLKELYKLWRPESPLFKKQNTHEALDDIRESIKELLFYSKEFIIME